MREWGRGGGGGGQTRCHVSSSFYIDITVVDMTNKGKQTAVGTHGVNIVPIKHHW